MCIVGKSLSVVMTFRVCLCEMCFLLLFGCKPLDTLSQEEEKLENLRTRATCPICREFYTKPKRLDKCPHVFCLSCIKRHLQANHRVNFPGCPMCRIPILKPLSEINDLEPGRAEEDIVNFVKPYETCGLCDQKENPKFSCFECKCLICDSCKPCHKKLKPTHILNPLIPSASYNRPHSLQICPQHQEQTRDLFWIICQTMLCSYCETYYHRTACRRRCGDKKVVMRFKYGFLQEYVKANEERISQFKLSQLPRVVYLNEFVKESKIWLENVSTGLDECINFFRKYQSDTAEIIDATKQCKALTPRTQVIKDETDTILKRTETVNKHIVKLLENAVSSEIANSVLVIEQKVLQLFMLRRKYTAEIRPLRLDFDEGKLFKQVLTGFLQAPSGSFVGLVYIPYQESLNKINSEYLNFKSGSELTEAEGNRDSHRVETDKTVSVFHDIICAYDTSEGETEIGSKQLSNALTSGLSFTFNFERRNNNLFYSSNNVYTNEVVGKTKFPMSSQVNTVDTGYAVELPYEYSADWTWFRVRMNENENPRIVVEFYPDVRDCRVVPVRIVTSFTNVFVVPFLLNVNGGYDPKPRQSPCLFSFIGNRNSNSGLETTFMHFDKTVANIYGSCIRTNIAKFDSFRPVELENNHKSMSVKNKCGSYSLFSIQAEGLFIATYRTNILDTSAPENYPQYLNIKEKSETIIPVNFVTVSLLCSTVNGLYFAKHDELDKLTIGKMCFQSSR